MHSYPLMMTNEKCLVTEHENGTNLTTLEYLNIHFNYWFRIVISSNLSDY